jgi:prepilin-type N-terminal cleavage/methylation domain-containing protein
MVEVEVSWRVNLSMMKPRGSKVARFSQGRGAVRAFTLLEVILAMVVIGLLACLAIPAVRTAREKAERGADVSHLRQIGVALLCFAGDHDNNFPVAAGRIGWGETSPVTGAGPWTQQILPYLSGNTNVFRSRRSPSADPPGTFSPGYFLGARPAMAADRRFGAVNLLRMEAPSQTVLAGTVGSGQLFRPGDWDKDDYTQSPAFDGNRRSRLTHPVAILFADGHVRECAAFDTNEMTVEYGKGKWYGF